MNRKQITAAAATAALVNFRDYSVNTTARIVSGDMWSCRYSFGQAPRYSRSHRTTAKTDNYESHGYVVVKINRPLGRILTADEIAAAEAFMTNPALTVDDLLGDDRRVDFAKLPANVSVQIINPRDLTAR